MPTYSVSDLPALPVGMNEVVPMAFVKNGTLHKPVYHDGTIWRYLNTDMPVVKEVTTNPVVLNYLLLPSSTGFWKLTATDSGEISTSKYPNIGSNSPLPTPLLVSSSVGIWYVSADASGTPRTQLIGGTYPPTQVRISSDNLVWEVLASNTGEIFLQRI